MDEVNDITTAIKDNTTKSRLQKASRYLLAALVGAAALAVVAKKSTNQDNTEEV